MTTVIYGEYVFNTIIYADVYFVGIINNNYYIIYLVELPVCCQFLFLGGKIYGSSAEDLCIGAHKGWQ